MEQRWGETVLGLAGLVTLAGVLLFGFAVSQIFSSDGGTAIVAFIMGIVAWIVAFHLYASFARYRRRASEDRDE
jgi:positive regulator of sigma E activity